MKPEVARFVQEMLRLIRREFFAQNTDKRFFQERPKLIEAITWPARWMNDHGARLPASDYRRILGIVIDTIKRKGNRAKIQRFSIYFLHAVQEHIKHHGDQYYYEAKAARPIGAILPAVTRHVRPGAAPDRTTETLSQMNRILRSPGGRRRRIRSGKNSASEGDLFGLCKPAAARLQNGAEHSQTFAKSP
jgi:hypothetical protein